MRVDFLGFIIIIMAAVNTAMAVAASNTSATLGWLAATFAFVGLYVEFDEDEEDEEDGS